MSVQIFLTTSREVVDSYSLMSRAQRKKTANINFQIFWFDLTRDLTALEASKLPCDHRGNREQQWHVGWRIGLCWANLLIVIVTIEILIIFPTLQWPYFDTNFIQLHKRIWKTHFCAQLKVKLDRCLRESKRFMIKHI